MHRPVQLPAELNGALATLLGKSVDDVRLVERSWRVRWHPRMLATTRRSCIYLRGTVDEFAANPELVLHEYFHVIEQWGPKRLTRWRYVAEWLRRGYRANRFEVETREFVARNLARFHLLIGER